MPTFMALIFAIALTLAALLLLGAILVFLYFQGLESGSGPEIPVESRRANGNTGRTVATQARAQEDGSWSPPARVERAA